MDISAPEVGDVVRAGGIDVEICSLEEKDGDLLINGGIDEAWLQPAAL